MPKYKFVAKDRTGRKITKTVTAINILDLYQILDSEGLFLIRDPEIIEETEQNRKKRFFQSSVDTESLIIAFKILTTLLDSGVSVPNALDDVSKGLKDKKLAQILMTIRERILQGSTFSQACANYPEAFDNEMIEAIKVGELTGDLSKVLKIQIKKLEQELKLKKQIKKQSIYPIFLITLVLIVFSVVTLYFIPKMMESFASILPDSGLPPKTKLIMTINNFIIHRGWVLILGFISTILGWILMKYNKYTRQIRDTIVWKLPVIGTAVKFLNLAKASQVLHTGLSSGLGIPECLASMQRGSTNWVFTKEIMRVRSAVESGLSLSQAVRPETTDHLFAALIRAGEFSGRLAEVMENSMNYYFEAAQEKLESALSLSTYIVILLLGVIVAYTMLSVIIPTYELPTMIT